MDSDCGRNAEGPGRLTGRLEGRQARTMVQGGGYMKATYTAEYVIKEAGVYSIQVWLEYKALPNDIVEKANPKGMDKDPLKVPGHSALVLNQAYREARNPFDPDGRRANGWPGRLQVVIKPEEIEYDLSGEGMLRAEPHMPGGNAFQIVVWLTIPAGWMNFGYRIRPRLRAWNTKSAQLAESAGWKARRLHPLHTAPASPGSRPPPLVGTRLGACMECTPDCSRGRAQRRKRSAGWAAVGAPEGLGDAAGGAPCWARSPQLSTLKVIDLYHMTEGRPEKMDGTHFGNDTDRTNIQFVCDCGAAACAQLLCGATEGAATEGSATEGVPVLSRTALNLVLGALCGDSKRISSKQGSPGRPPTLSETDEMEWPNW
eukprot:gene422-783_t